MKKFLILLLLAASSFNSVFALDKPQSGREDKRVFYTDYKPDEIYPISAVNGLITTITMIPFIANPTELVGAMPLHLACARPLCRLKAPLGLSLLRKRSLVEKYRTARIYSP